MTSLDKFRPIKSAKQYPLGLGELEPVMTHTQNVS